MNQIALENFKIDKTNWKIIKLGDVVYEPKETLKDPVKDGIQHVVGLEHIDSEDIHLRRSASIDESTTFTKKFRKGDVLFGRRRAYLKKAAIAEFDGICSGDITVMRAKDGLLTELLPFIINNDRFFDYAITHSAGGLSPRVKFNDLAKYQFSLPPIDEQRDFLKLVRSLYDLLPLNDSLLRNIQNYKKSLFYNEIFRDSKRFDPFFFNRESKFRVEKLVTILKSVQYGISDSLSDSGEIPILRMNNLQNGKLDLTDLKYYTPKMNELNRFILDTGDILFNRTNSFDLVGKVSLFLENEKYSFASYLIRLKADREKLDPRYANFYLNSEVGLSKIRRYRTPGVSQCNINAQNLKNIPIPLPSIKEQIELMNRIDLLESAELNLQKKISDTKLLLKRLINEMI